MPKSSFFIFCLMFFAVSFGVAAMAALIPSIAVYFGIAKEYALCLTWLYMLPYGVVALLWGPLSRLIKVKNILLTTSAGYCAASVFFATSGTIEQAFIFRFLMGCFGCSFVPLALITIGKTVSKEKKSKYIGIFFALSYSSTLISVFLSGYLHWRAIYLVPAFLSFLVFLLILFFLHDFDFRRDKFRFSYHQTFKDKQALCFFLVIMLGSFLYHSLQQRLGIYLSSAFVLTQVMISTIFTASTLSSIVFEFSGGFLSSRIGAVTVARIGFILMSIFSLLLLMIQRYEYMFGAILLWGSGWALTHVGLSSHLTHFPDRILRDASSLNSALRFSFGGLGAFAGGALVSALGFKILFMIVAVGIFLLGFYLNRIIR